MRRNTACSYLVLLILGLAAVLACTPTSPTSSPRSASGLTVTPTQNRRPGFSTQVSSFSDIPACADPLSVDLVAPSNAPATNPIGVQFYRTVLNKYGYFEPRDANGNIVWSAFARGSLVLDRDPMTHDIRVVGVRFETNDGDNWYVYVASGGQTHVQTYNEDFTLTLGSAVFSYSNSYGSDNYVGGGGQVEYQHDSRKAIVTLDGGGLLIPNGSSFAGEAFFQGSATFSVNLPHEKFELQVEGMADIDLGIPATLRAFEDYCKQGWKLTISGMATVPDLQGGLSCDWTYPGGIGHQDQTVLWNGKCDDGRWMKPGSYPVKLESQGTPRLTDTQTISVASNGVVPTPTPSATPCLPTDPGCPLECPPGQVCPPPGPSGGPSGGPSPSEGPSPEASESPGPSPSTSTGPSPSSSPSPTPTPPIPTATPGGGAECNEPGYRKVRFKDEDQEVCIYCPEDYFKFNDDPHIGCYTILNFKISQDRDSGVSPPTFSPRDVNGQFDKLNFSTENPFNIQSVDSIKWDMRVEAETGPLVGDTAFDGGPALKNQEGVQSIPFDGWVTNQSCLIDGKYKLKLLPKSENPTGKSGFYLIKVPDYDEPVEARLLINPSFDQDDKLLDEKPELEFWVDNTPPLPGFVDIHEELVQQQPLQYKTTVKFLVKETEIYGSHSFLQADVNQVTVYVDDAPFYTMPEFSASDLFINSVQFPSDFQVVQDPSHLTAQVVFTVPFRLKGHTVDVELGDTLNNQGRYNLYPKGENF